jgi:predicted Rossmann fold flavoprotein
VTHSPRAVIRRRVAVIGAGAAGTLAAIFAATQGAETLLLERTADGGRKILISGGGRCNILPARVDERRFVTDSSPNSLRKMLRSWPLSEQIAFFERELGQPLVEEEESAKLFPASNRARDVRDGLLALAARRGARFVPSTWVTDLVPGDRGWRVLSARAEPLEVDAVVVATGGLSVPKTGSDGTGLAILQRLGHVVHPTYAALTPITDGAGVFASLAGVSLPVTVTARSDGRHATATGGFLFTHHGYSGPSVLDVSHVLTRAEGAGAAGRRAARRRGRGAGHCARAAPPGGTGQADRDAHPGRAAVDRGRGIQEG